MERRRNAIYLIIGASLIAGLITGRDFFFNMAYAFAGLLIFSFLWAWTGANWVRLTRHTPARHAQVGRYFTEHFHMHNSSFIPKLWVEVHDGSDLPGHRASHVVNNLGAHRSQAWTVRTLCVQRGEFRLGPLRHLTSGDPFGLFEVKRHISVTGKLVVYPATADIRYFALPVGLLPGGDALRRRTHYVTANAASVRDYAPGDSFSRIHWPSTARRDRLIVKEFELDPLADIWIVLDAERTVHVGEYIPTEQDAERMPWEDASLSLPPTTEEYAVAVTASLAQYLLRHDRSVGLAAFGRRRQIIQADRGERQLGKILEGLAVVRAQGSLTLDQVLGLEGDQLAGGTTLIVITPSTRDAWVIAAQRLHRRGLRVIGVLIDAESFGGRPGARRVASLLAATSIPALIVRQGDEIGLALSVTYHQAPEARRI
jgi:uncharacterized protein (DUF58 family)